jgi:hypothetical protein
VCKRSGGERGKGGREIHILRIEHPVPNFDTWKTAFDSDPIGRKQSGVHRYRIPTDDPNYVMVGLEFDSESEADGLSSGLSGNVNLGGLSSGFPGVEARVVGARLTTPSAAVSATAKANKWGLGKTLETPLSSWF